MSELNRPSWFRAPSALVLRALSMSARTLVVVAGAAVALANPALAQSEGRVAYDTFLATTTDMSPEGVTLRIVVREWPDDVARAAVTGVLAEADDVASALAELPSVGVVWRSGSGVGHALKYAHREQTDSGQERLTFVTEKPIDSYSFGKWEIEGTESRPDPGYTVIELMLDESGSGMGTLSLAADVSVDQDSASVSLVSDGDTPVVLADAHEQPKPYWASRDDGA